MHILILNFPILFIPRHTKYVGVYSFCFSVRSFVCTFIRLSITQGQSFCVKVYKTSYFEDFLMDFIHIWPDGRYRSKVFISTIPTPEVTLGSRSWTRNFHKKSKFFVVRFIYLYHQDPLRNFIYI